MSFEVCRISLTEDATPEEYKYGDLIIFVRSFEQGFALLAQMGREGWTIVGNVAFGEDGVQEAYTLQRPIKIVQKAPSIEV